MGTETQRWESPRRPEPRGQGPRTERRTDRRRRDGTMGCGRRSQRTPRSARKPVLWHRDCVGMKVRPNILLLWALRPGTALNEQTVFQFPRRGETQPRNLLLSCPHTWVHTGTPVPAAVPPPRGPGGRDCGQGIGTTWGDVLPSSVGPLSTRLRSVCPTVLVTITCVRRAGLTSGTTDVLCAEKVGVTKKYGSRGSVWPVGVRVSTRQPW